MTEGKARIIGGLFFAMAGAGLIRIGWAYLKDGSLIEASAIIIVGTGGIHQLDQARLISYEGNQY